MKYLLYDLKLRLFDNITNVTIRLQNTTYKNKHIKDLAILF